MSVFIERKNINVVHGENGIVASFVADMLANGFTQKYPSTPFNPATDATVILEADTTVNSISAQPWAIKFEVVEDPNGEQDSVCECFVGAPEMFDYTTGAHTEFEAKYLAQSDHPGTALTKNEGLGIIGSLLNREEEEEKAQTTNKFLPVPLDKKSKSFIYRAHRALSEVVTYPMSYTLSISTRGFVLMVGEQNDTSGIQQSWLCVQRPVDNLTGAEVVTGHTPVHCMYATCTFVIDNPQINYDIAVKAANDQGTQVAAHKPKTFNVRRFVVREDDIVSPYPLPRYLKDEFAKNQDYAEGGWYFGIPADEHTVDFNAVMNSKQQVSITEDNKYVITFPSGLNTSRFAYTHELDMIAYTSADVVARNAEVSITVYGEDNPRVYVAGPSSGPNNTGVRMLVLKSGGGI